LIKDIRGERQGIGNREQGTTPGRLFSDSRKAGRDGVPG